MEQAPLNGQVYLIKNSNTGWNIIDPEPISDPNAYPKVITQKSPQDGPSVRVRASQSAQNGLWTFSSTSDNRFISQCDLEWDGGRRNAVWKNEAFQWNVVLSETGLGFNIYTSLGPPSVRLYASTDLQSGATASGDRVADTSGGGEPTNCNTYPPCGTPVFTSAAETAQSVWLFVTPPPQ